MLLLYYYSKNCGLPVSYSGTSVERDFVEAPSQMLENWVWQREALSRMSGHYSNGSCIPEDLMDSLIKSHVANAGVFNLRQILLGTFDQLIHTQTAKVGLFRPTCRGNGTSVVSFDK